MMVSPSGDLMLAHPVPGFDGGMSPAGLPVDGQIGAQAAAYNRRPTPA
jgi:hypothetical protein